LKSDLKSTIIYNKPHWSKGGHLNTHLCKVYFCKFSSWRTVIGGSLYLGVLIFAEHTSGALIFKGACIRKTYVFGGDYIRGVHIFGRAYTWGRLYSRELISGGAYILGSLYWTELISSERIPGGLISEGVYIRGSVYPGECISAEA